jgi:lysophospholipase
MIKMGFVHYLTFLVFVHFLASAAPAPAPELHVRQFGTPSAARLASQLDVRQLGNPYAPGRGACPATFPFPPASPLVRPADNINPSEAAYISSRKPKADAALSAWLSRQGQFNTSRQPVVGFTSAGGGLRALLCTAGVVQGLDIRDSNQNTSGLYQGITYHSALSGGAWFLSSFAGNDWPTISYLKKTLWEDAFQNTLLLPANPLDINDDLEYATITGNLAAKQAAGYDATIVDPYGRLLSYQLLQGPQGGVSTRLSDLSGQSNFTQYNVPYPIITAIGVPGYQGGCVPADNAPQYEFHPYEYGSWDTGISAFATTQYMGTAMTNGTPTVPGNCTINYDNLGYIFGTSSDVFFAICAVLQPINSPSANLSNVLEAWVNLTHRPTFQDLFGIYKNPFYQYPRSSAVSNDFLLTLVDGGASNQNNPIWPFIQPARKVDVLIVNDNSADTSNMYPSGTAIQQTYLVSQSAGLTKMPFIPDSSTFIAQGLNKRATFFGCNETDKVFIVYLPNVGYTFDSGQSTFKIQYSKQDTDAMIANGVQVANQNGTEGWSFCLACAIRHRDGDGVGGQGGLPEGCGGCFERYCYRGDGTGG